MLLLGLFVSLFSIAKLSLVDPVVGDLFPEGS